MQSEQTPRSQFRALVFPGSTEIGLEIQRALAGLKEVTLFSASSEISSHAPYVFRNHFQLPDVRTSGWRQALNELIRQRSITHILPAHDTVLLALAENAEAIDAAVVTSPLQTCRTARSKAATYQLLGQHLPVVNVFPAVDEVPDFPAFVKPDMGQGAQGTALIQDPATLKHFLSAHPNSLICEYLPGDEFTIDCFSDRRDGLQFVAGRQRVRVRSGIAMDSRPVERPEFEEYARIIASSLEFHGAWFFQLKANSSGLLKVLEVAPRIAGTSALQRVRGVNLPLLSLYEASGVACQAAPQAFDVNLDRALVNRYRLNLDFDTVYVDLDDTLVVRGKVNVPLVSLLYQFLNVRKRLVLLTRHNGDLGSTLARHRLAGLFDEVVHLTKGEAKALKIDNRAKAIFIDDSFAERQAVHRGAGIPVFDTSSIEGLRDDRS